MFNLTCFSYRLQQLCDKLQQQNDELESRFLQTVEKVEQDKLLLSNEIDHLAERLANATNITSYLEHECQRYKHDCQIAVQLLQCRPSYMNAAVSNEKIKDFIDNYAINRMVCRHFKFFEVASHGESRN
uniref:Uncharacterized protein n=1 Tax=Romanomermis culicivorax TaxID=13658 RepID=A0A915HWE5_ROMCU